MRRLFFVVFLCLSTFALSQQRGPAEDLPKLEHLSADQVHRVIDAAAKVGRQGERDKLLLTLIYRHGLRVSEAVDLRWSDFDLESRP